MKKLNTTDWRILVIIIIIDATQMFELGLERAAAMELRIVQRISNQRRHREIAHHLPVVSTSLSSLYLYY